MEALGINLGYLLVQILMFGIVFVTLKKWVYTPVLGLLEKRRQSVAQGLEDARIAAEARASAERDANKIIADAQIKASEVIKDASEKAEIRSKEILAEKELDIERALEAQKVEIDQERNRILSDLRNQVITLAMAATQKLIGDSLDEKRQRALLEEFFSGVKGDRFMVVEGQNVAGSFSEVTSALPLTREEQDIIKKDLNVRTGVSGTVSFVVDPGILGGVIVKIGDHVIDSSLSGQIQALRATMH